jgi:hypothetical protein
MNVLHHTLIVAIVSVFLAGCATPPESTDPRPPHVITSTPPASGPTNEGTYPPTLEPNEPEQPYEIAWIKQLGSSGRDICYSVVLDAAGDTHITGALGGDPDGGDADIDGAFVAKFDGDGNRTWIASTGEAITDTGHTISVAVDGSVRMAGKVYDNPSRHGFPDGFVSRLDSEGNIAWTSQLATEEMDFPCSIAADTEGNTFVSGFTEGELSGTSFGSIDAFLAKFDTEGDNVWTIQLGTTGQDNATGVAVDAAGNVYIAGGVEGNLSAPSLGDADAFIARYDTEGNEVWTTQTGTTAKDYASDIVVDEEGNVYISGHTEGELGLVHAGEKDAFLAKFDADGNYLWATQVGTANTELSTDVALDAAGNVYISGFTTGDLAGANAGKADIFLAKFDADGNEIWITQLGTPEEDQAYSIALDTDGNVYLAGRTEGDLDGENAGHSDAFLMKLVPPEP